MHWLSLLLLFLLSACSTLELAEGNRYYQRGDYTRAASAYGAAFAGGERSPALRYNLGTALLRLERYEDARPHLEAAARVEDAELRQRARYNAGNTDLEPVFHNRPSAPRAEHLERAILSYRDALLIAPSDRDAKWNLELAQRLLEQEQRSSGGGGGDSPQTGGGGGDREGEDTQAPARPDRPAPATGGGEQPRMSRAEADRLFGALDETERDVQREALEREQTAPPRVRDW